jgi:hypothetical protein
MDTRDSVRGGAFVETQTPLDLHARPYGCSGEMGAGAEGDVDASNFRI